MADVWTRRGGDRAPSAEDRGHVPGPLVGRERELQDLRTLLENHRLVTVAGEVGVGKSRLAAEAVADVVALGAGECVLGAGERRPAGEAIAGVVAQGPGESVRGVGEDRIAAEAVAGVGARGAGPRIMVVRWSEGGQDAGCGAGPGSPASLTAAVMEAAAGIHGRRGAAGVGAVADRLRAADVLLFLDDVDPVHAECVGMVQTLMEFVPSLRVLVTTRRPLGLGGEAVLRLAPLSVEPVDGHGTGPAAELFLDRFLDRSLERAGASFDADESELSSVADICRYVGGLPLAVELAAEQAARSSVGEVAERLKEHQCWLSAPDMAAPRHRSLRDAVAAPYVLCDRDERIVWARASILAGDFDESTAAFVCAGGGLAPARVPACLTRLAAVGVLTPVRDPGGIREPRYRMAPAAHDFGGERLREAREFEVAAERRAIHFHRVAALAENLWSLGSQPQAVRLVLDEAEGLRAMLEYAPRQPELAAAALESVLNLWFWWAVYDAADEGRRHLLRLLPMCRSDTLLIARGLCLAAWLTAYGDPYGASELLQHAWSAAVLAGDDATIGRIAHVQGMLALHEGDLERATEQFQEAANTIPPHVSGGLPPAVSLAALAVTQTQQSPRAARRSVRRALSQPGIRGDAWACLVARYAQAFVDHSDGRTGRARLRAHRALAALDGRLPAPHGCAALRDLITDIDRGSRSGLPTAAVPRGLTGVAIPKQADSGILG
ncbi:ATP-binding protein [Streptomyces sp. NPDC057681]|uniref:ATP-binding protein n=1 Tax=Streptomyces sp. NPDC057681 TaxID=3346209 RepID=UPI0036951540